MRVLLIQPPFLTAHAPSLGLSYLKAALQRAGIEAEILYSNLMFAHVIGWDVYESIQHRAPVELLFGDLVFGPALRGGAIEEDRIQAFLRGFVDKRPRPRSVPSDLFEMYPTLAEQAVRYTDRLGSEGAWESYDLIGITTTFSLVPALAIAKAIKRRKEAPPVVLGGGHCDGCMGESILQLFPWIDYVGRGDGEDLIVALARYLETSEPAPEQIDGLLWRSGNGISSANTPVARLDDLNDLPEPVFHDWLACQASMGRTDKTVMRLPLETTRGCWYGQKGQCAFCGLNGSSVAFRSKGPDRILKEYRALQQYGIPMINAVDNVLDPKHFREVIPRIQSLPAKTVMFFEVRPTHPREQLASLKRAGVHILQPGIESLSTRLLRLMNKGTNAFLNVRLLKWASELGMPVAWNMLYGLPGEEASDYAQMAELVPSLLHLFPPATQCNPVHVDRFSPLFQSHQDSIEPIVPYSMATGLEPRLLRDLAYHFEFIGQWNAKMEVVEAIEALRAKLVDWQEAVGKVAFVSLERSGARWLYDTRQQQLPVMTRLEGWGAEAFRLMESGVTREAMGTALEIGKPQLDRWLTECLDRRWAVVLDGKWLSLAVTMDDEVPQDIPSDLQGSVATALYQHRMSSLWASINR